MKEVLSVTDLTPTVGNITVGNITLDNTYYPWGVPQGTIDWQPNTTIWYTPQEPVYCSGNVHVFGCDHAEKCKCGKSKRKVEPPICPHCQKAHG